MIFSLSSKRLKTKRYQMTRDRTREPAPVAGRAAHRAKMWRRGRRRRRVCAEMGAESEAAKRAPTLAN